MKDQVPSGAGPVPLQTQAHNPLMDSVVLLLPLHVGVHPSLHNLPRTLEPPGAFLPSCPDAPVLPTSSVSGVIDLSHQLVLARPDLV